MDDQLKVSLPVFEGPLDLLLHLIQKNKVDIYDIPILEITRQYLAYLKSWDDMNMDVASEFIVMAATLISIKSRKLLPMAQQQDQEEDDQEQELIRRLLLYQRFKEASGRLKQSEIDPMHGYVLRQPEKIRGQRLLPSVRTLLDGVDLDSLEALYRSLLISRRESIDEQRASFKGVRKERYRVADKIKALEEALDRVEEISYYDLRKKSRSREEEITYFMAMLELSRLDQVALTQKELFGDIIASKAEGEHTDGNDR